MNPNRVNIVERLRNLGFICFQASYTASLATQHHPSAYLESRTSAIHEKDGGVTGGRGVPGTRLHPPKAER